LALKDVSASTMHTNPTMGISRQFCTRTNTFFLFDCSIFFRVVKNALFLRPCPCVPALLFKGSFFQK
jgi:hypothetical protein